VTAAVQPSLAGVSVLLVEDERAFAVALARVLQQAGAEVTLVATLAGAQAALDVPGKWNVVLLDQQLPDGDGLDVTETFRDWEEKPAIVATSVNLQDSKRSLKLQSCGAILLPKPFGADDLFAAIAGALASRTAERALSRPPPSLESGEYTARLRFGPISVHLVSQSATVDGTRIELQPAQFRILAKLLANVGRALGVNELVEGTLRGTHQDGTVNIRFQIHALRRRLGEAGALIETTPGGYGIGLGTTDRYVSKS
jgi:two-component system KDP operon response regulator KdpE